MKNLLMVLLILMLSIVACSSDEKLIADTEASSENKIPEGQQPIEQKPVEQKPIKPVEQKLVEQKPIEQEPETNEESENEQIPVPAEKPKEINPQFEEYTTTEQEQTPSSEEPEEIISQSKEYTGEDRGIGGPIIVLVTMQDNKISRIEVISHNETKGVSENAIDTIISSIIEKQSTDVDAVTGATITSKALMNAVKNALEKKE